MRSTAFLILLLGLGLRVQASTPACGSGIHYVIGGKYYPASQFNILGSGHPGCTSAHFHAFNGSFITATDATTLADPNPGGCGYGTSLSVFDPCVSGGSFTPLAAPATAAEVLGLNADPQNPFASAMLAIHQSDPMDLFMGYFGLYGPRPDFGTPTPTPVPGSFSRSYDGLVPGSQPAQDSGRQDLFRQWEGLTQRETQRRDASAPKPAGSKDLAALDPAAFSEPGKDQPLCGASAPPSSVPSLFDRPAQGPRPASQQPAAVSHLSWLESFQREQSQRDADKDEAQADIERRQADDWRDIAENRRKNARDAREAGREGEAEDWDKEARDADAQADELDRQAGRDQANADRRRADADRIQREAEQRAREKAEAEQRAREAKEQARLRKEQEAREKEERRLWEERRKAEEARLREEAKRDRQAAREREAEERRRQAADQARRREQQARQQRESLERRLKAYEQWEQKNGRPHPRTASTREALAAAGGAGSPAPAGGDPNELFKDKGLDVGTELAGELAGLRAPGVGDAVGGLVTLKNVSEFGETAQKVVDRGAAQNAAIERAMEGVVNGTVSPEEFRRVQNGAFFGNAAELLKAGTSAAY